MLDETIRKTMGRNLKKTPELKQPNPAYIQELMKIINHSPFPTHLGMKLQSIEFDHAVIALEINPVHLQAYGIVHGGVLATLIDTATFWAVYLRIPEAAGLVNIDLKLNYLEPVSQGLLTAEARAIRAGRSISYAEATVYRADGKPVAHGTSSLMILPERGLPIRIAKFLSSS